MEFNFSIGFKTGKKEKALPEIVMQPEAPTASEADKISAMMPVGRPELMPVSKKWLQAKAFVHGRDMRRDPVLDSCLDYKCDVPMQSGWKVKPASDEAIDKKAAEFIERAFSEMDGDGAYGVVENLLDAVAIGFSAQQKVWDHTSAGELFIRDTIPHDPQSLSFTIDDFYRVTEIRTTIAGKTQRTPLPVAKFIYWAHKPLYGSPYGQGDFAKAYRAWYSKNQAIIYWTRYLERNARGGIPVVKYRDGVTTAMQEKIDEQMSLEGTLGSVHLPNEITDFKFEAALSASVGETFHAFVKTCNEEMARGLLGSSLMVDEGSRVGSKAMAAVHAQTSRVGSKKLARKIETVMNMQFIRPQVKANFPGIKAFPTLVLPQPSPEETAAKAELVWAAVDRRVLSPEEEWIRSALGFEPDDRDKVVIAKEKEERDAERTIKEIAEGKEAEGDPAEEEESKTE